MSWYITSQKIDGAFITAYHGSDESGIEKLRASLPPYEGGIGFGVYLGLNRDTAKFYGRHIYECRVNLIWDNVLDLSEENVNFLEGFEGHSISAGEQIYPFYFYIKGQKYIVTDMSMNFGESWVKKTSLLDKFESLVEDRNPWWKPYISFLIEKAKRYGDFVSEDRDDIEESFWDVISSLDGEGKLPADFDDKVFEIKIQSAIPEVMALIEETKKEFENIIEISLEEIGEIAEQAGYKAVYLAGVRNFHINEELLVFNEDDVEVLRQLK